jgi:hypothetical protein
MTSLTCHWPVALILLGLLTLLCCVCRPSRRQRHLLVPQLHEQLLQLLQGRPGLPSSTDSLRQPRWQAGVVQQLPGAGEELVLCGARPRDTNRQGCCGTVSTTSSAAWSCHTWALRAECLGLVCASGQLIMSHLGPSRVYHTCHKMPLECSAVPSGRLTALLAAPACCCQHCLPPAAS